MSEHAKSVPRKPPKDITNSCYSNLDHQLDEEAEEQLRNGEVLSHAAWNHYGKVWFADGQFHEEIWQYHSKREVISKDSLRDVIDAVNERYGDD